MAQRSDDPASLVEKATQLSDLTELSVPFYLNAQIRIQTGSQKPVDATYRLEWISRESWRDELKMPQFEQIRTVLASRMWVERSIPYAPLQVWGAMEGIDIHSVLNMSPAPSLGNIRRKKENGSLMQCVEMGEPGQRTSEACFAVGSGDLLRITRSDGLRFTYSDYVVWQGKNYPKAIQIFENESQLADVHVSDVGSLKESKFPNPSAQSRVFGWCSDPSPVKISKKVAPSYPLAARTTGTGGTVAVYGVVALDGKLHDMSVVASRGPELDTATTQALSKWIFQPATCHGTSIETELVTTVHYSVGH